MAKGNGHAIAPVPAVSPLRLDSAVELAVLLTNHATTLADVVANLAGMRAFLLAIEPRLVALERPAVTPADVWNERFSKIEHRLGAVERLFEHQGLTQRIERQIRDHVDGVVDRVNRLSSHTNERLQGLTDIQGRIDALTIQLGLLDEATREPSPAEVESVGRFVAIDERLTAIERRRSQVDRHYLEGLYTVLEERLHAVEQRTRLCDKPLKPSEPPEPAASKPAKRKRHA